MESIGHLIYYIRQKDGPGIVSTFKQAKVSHQTFRNLDLGVTDSIDDQLNAAFTSSHKNYEVLKQILIAFYQFNNSLRGIYDVKDHFDKYAELLKYFNRFAESQTVWIIEPLIYLTRNLISYATKADDFISKNPNSKNQLAVGDFEEETCLTQTARIVHNSFKLCFNDRNEDPTTSRKSQIYFFVGLELKIYFKLQNRDLAKNMEKVLAAKKDELPDLDKISKSQAITYLYYSGATSCGNIDFKNAYLKFQKAYQLCSKYDTKHKQAILVYLIPLKFLITRKLINLKTIEHEFPLIKNLYGDFVTSIGRGDIKLFDRFFTQFEHLFLTKNLFIAIENIRSFILLKLVKKTFQWNKQHPHLPLNLITRAIEFSKYHTNDQSASTKNINIFSSDETECLISNLIYKGYIKGYLSHTNGVLVLSKKEPFPKQVKSDEEIV